MPMEKILENLLLPDSVSEALLQRGGMYGPFLELAEACEDPEMANVRPLAEKLHITPEMLNRDHIAALAWVEELGV